MVSVLESVNSFIWGIPVLFLILITGIVLCIRSCFAQIRLFPLAVKCFTKSFQKVENGNNAVSGYRALCTALAATVGTGNIAGVAGAIAIGGPGAIFWMWVCGLVGMITKFAEVTLAVHFRSREKNGEYVGGPMYTIQNGLHQRYHCLAYIYSFFCIVAALGIGNAVQVNAVINGITNVVNMTQSNLSLTHRGAIGVLISLILVPIFRNGPKQIGTIAEALVPIASIIYILMSFAVLSIRFYMIPVALKTITNGVFSPYAVTGGVLGSAFTALRIGASRGVFTNEAGMGTASIAHAASNAKHPVQQGLLGIIEVFLDTIVICTLTALVILCSGVSIPYGMDPGITLSLDAFALVLGDWSRAILTLLTCVFAFATMLGWGLYGARSCQYLFGVNAWNYFVYFQAGAVVIGSVLSTSVVWVLAEVVNGLMAIPNLIALMALSGVFIGLIKDFQKKENAYRL